MNKHPELKKMTLFKKSGKLSGKQPSANSPANASSPAPMPDDTTLSNLPVLTEIVADANPQLTRPLNEVEKQQLLFKLERHLETLLSQKLALYLEQVQRVAIDQAIYELKSELPELLREALNAHLDSH
jgi:hypothetical protein